MNCVACCLNQDLRDLGIFRIVGDRWSVGTAGVRGRGSGGGGRGEGSGGRGQGGGVRGQGSGVRGQGSGVRGQGSGGRGQGSGVRGEGSGGGRGQGGGVRGQGRGQGRGRGGVRGEGSGGRGQGGRGQGGGVRGEGPETRAAAAGLVLKGGVAGGVPPHKGGPKARPPKTKREGRGVRSEKNLCWQHKGTRKAVTVRDAFGYRVGLICVGTNWLWV